MSSASKAPRRVLVVDAEATGSQIAVHLARAGLAVERLADGEQAWRRFLAWAPQLVICAERLPAHSGLQLCQNIRQLGSRARVLLLFSQTLTPDAEAELCADLGCDAVLGQPLHLEQVVAWLQRWELWPAETARPPPTVEDAWPVTGVLPLPVPLPSAAPAPEPPPGEPAPMSLPEHQPSVGGAPGGALADRPPLASVSRPARGLGDVPPFGELADLPLPRLLYRLFAARFHGVLELQRQGVRRAIYLWAGMPVRVDSEQLQDSLGVMLAEERLVDEAQLARAKALVLERGIALGAALVAIGALGERELLAALRRQTERKLLRTFAWGDGTFVVREETGFAADTVLCEVEPLAVIWRGIRAQVAAGPLMEFFTRFATRYVVTSEAFALQWPALAPVVGDLPLWPLLDGQHTFAAALISDAGRTLELAQALYALLVTDMISASDRPGPPVLRPAPTQAAQPVDYERLAAVADRIAARYLRLKSGESAALLELGPEASHAELEAACQRLARELDEDAATPGLGGDERRRLRELVDALPELRGAGLALLGRAGGTEGQSPPARSDDERRRGERRRQRLVAEQAYRAAQALMPRAPREARQRAREAIALCPEEPAYHVALAQALRAGGAEVGEPADELAGHALAEALRLDPTHLLANLEQARLYVARGLPATARAALQRVLDRAPEHAAARALLVQLDAGGLAPPGESGDHRRP